MESQFEKVDDFDLIRKINLFYASERRRSLFLAMSIFAHLFILVSMPAQFKADYEYVERLSRILPYVIGVFLCSSSTSVCIQMCEEGNEAGIPWQKVLGDLGRSFILILGFEQAFLSWNIEKLDYYGFIGLCLIRIMAYLGLTICYTWELFTLPTKKFLKAIFGPFTITIPIFTYMCYVALSPESLRTIPDQSFLSIMFSMFVPLTFLHCTIGRLLAKPPRTSKSSCIFLLVSSLCLLISCWLQMSINLHADPRSLKIDLKWVYTKKVSHLFTPLLPFLSPVKYVKVMTIFLAHAGIIGISHGSAVLPRRSMRKIFDDFRKYGRVIVGACEFVVDSPRKLKKSVIHPLDGKFGKKM